MSPSAKPSAHGLPQPQSRGESPAAHPSFFLLDRIHLDGLRGFVDEALRDPRLHVGSCADCQAYLASLAEQAARTTPIPLRALKPVSLWSRIRDAFFRPLVVGPTLAACTVLCLYIVIRRPPEQPTPSPSLSSEKGGPSIRVYIKRDERVSVWDGRAPLYPRDRIRLEVAGSGFRFVTVASPEADDSGRSILRAIYAGPLRADAPTQLPASWTLDQAGGAEILHILLSHKPLPPAGLDLAGLRRESQVSVHTLVFRKETPK